MHPPSRAVPGRDDHGYGPFKTVVKSFMHPGTLVRVYQHRNKKIVLWVSEGVIGHDDRWSNELVTDLDQLMIMNADSGS